MVAEYVRFTKDNGYFDFKRNEQAKYWMYESINETLKDSFYNNKAVTAILSQTENQVLSNEIRHSKLIFALFYLVEHKNPANPILLL